MSNKNNRNDPCTCGSGKKHKKCCGFQALAAQQTKLGASLLGTATALGKMKKNILKIKQKEEPIQDILKKNFKRVFSVGGAE